MAVECATELFQRSHGPGHAEEPLLEMGDGVEPFCVIQGELSQGRGQVGREGAFFIGADGLARPGEQGQIVG